MAIPAHCMLLRRGAGVANRWRRVNGGRPIDVRGANLRGMTLRGVELFESRLDGALLRGGFLTKADLRAASLVKTDLGSARLCGANLQRADLRGIHATQANFTGADMAGCDLGGAALRRARLTRANLSRANLAYADLRGADLRGSNLSGADLRDAKLRGAAFESARLNRTVLCGVDVSEISGAADVTGPCKTDWGTVARSLNAPQLVSFLIQTGTPEVFATYMFECARTADTEDIFTMLQSVFISYGEPDEAFARELREVLRASGVATWFFPEDAVPGRRLHRVMQDEINRHDRVVLICSEGSLTRNGVLNEIERVLSREAKEGGAEILIPIALDRFVFDHWDPPQTGVADQVRDRVVADFTKCDPGSLEFRRAASTLLRALRR